MKDKFITLEIKKVTNIVKRNIDKSFKSQITNTQSFILSFIYENNRSGNTVNQKDIEDFLGIRRSTLSEILNTMEVNKLIKRNLSKSDLRKNEILLDTKGEVLIKEFKIQLDDLESFIKKDISKEELNTFYLVLEKIKKNLEDLWLNYLKI